MSRWTQEQKECLALLMKSGLSRKEIARQLGKSEPSVRTAVSRLGLKRKAFRRWDSAEKNKVREWQMAGISGEEQAKRLGRSYASWCRAVGRYGLQGNSRATQKPEIWSILIDLVGKKVKYSDMALVVGRSEENVRRCLCRLAARNLLVRLRPGEYVVSKGW